jgi:hypothetical protein
MTEEVAAAPDPAGEPLPGLLSADESETPVNYVLAADEGLYKVSERLISREHPSTANLKNLRKGLVSLAKFMNRMIYPREADEQLSELKKNFEPHRDSLVAMLGKTLSSLSDYIETLEALGETGTDTARSPADLGASVTVKGEKRDTFIEHFNAFRLKFQMVVKPLRPEGTSAD